MLAGLIPELTSATPGRCSSPRFPDLRLLITACRRLTGAGAMSFPEDVALGDEYEPAAPRGHHGRNRTAPAVPDIQFTSGTTAAERRDPHPSQYTSTTAFPRVRHVSLADRALIPVPMYHCFGMVLGVLTAVTRRRDVGVSAEAFEPLCVLETVERERCTALHGVPTVMSRNSSIRASGVPGLPPPAFGPGSWRVRRVRSR